MQLSWVRHLYKTHDRAEGAKHDEQIEEGADPQCSCQISTRLTHAQENKNAEQEKM